MSKRASERQLTKDDIVDEENGDDITDGGFPRASDDVLSTRRIVRARRPGKASEIPNPEPKASAAISFKAFTTSAVAAGTSDQAPDGGNVPPSEEPKPDSKDTAGGDGNAERSNAAEGGQDDEKNAKPNEGEPAVENDGAEEGKGEGKVSEAAEAQVQEATGEEEEEGDEVTSGPVEPKAGGSKEKGTEKEGKPKEEGKKDDSKVVAKAAPEPEPLGKPEGGAEADEEEGEGETGGASAPASGSLPLFGRLTPAGKDPASGFGGFSAFSSSAFASPFLAATAASGAAGSTAAAGSSPVPSFLAPSTGFSFSFATSSTFSFSTAPSSSSALFPPLSSVFGAKPAAAEAGAAEAEGEEEEGGEEGGGAGGSAAVGLGLGSATAPVVTLPEVEVATGEEGERAVLAAQAALFEFEEGKWRERGKGEVRLNVPEGGLGEEGEENGDGEDEEKGGSEEEAAAQDGEAEGVEAVNGKAGKRARQGHARLVMRAKGNLRLLLNANLFPAMKVSKMDGRGVTFTCVNSAAEAKEGAAQQALVAYALRMKDVDTADMLVELVEKYKKL